jgi:hypothetical protein
MRSNSIIGRRFLWVALLSLSVGPTDFARYRSDRH